MTLKDIKGMYTIKVDTTRGIVYEENVGLWQVEDVKRYHSDYVAKVAPLLKDKKWAKCTDLRKYKTSNISEGINEHTSWCSTNGLSAAVLIVESAIVKMQMNRSGAGIGLVPMACIDENEADAYLKSKGF